VSKLREHHISSLVTNENRSFDGNPIPPGTMVRYHTAWYSSLGTVVNFNTETNMVTVLWAVPPNTHIGSPLNMKELEEGD